MKKLVYSLAILTAVISGCSKNSSNDEAQKSVSGCTDKNATNYNAEATKDDGSCESVPREKRALFLYYTGSECNPCGSLGIPNYDNILSNSANANKVVAVSVHCNAPAPDELYEKKSGGELLGLIVSNGSYSAPTYLLPPLDKFSGSGSDAVSKANANIATLSAGDVVANAYVKATVDPTGLINVTTKTKFFQDASGVYKVAVLLMEDGVVFHQIANGSIVDPYTHDDVLRARMSTSVFGDQVAVGNITANQVFEKTFTTTIPAPNASKPYLNWNKSNLSAVVIIWNDKTAGPDEIVNVREVKVNPI